MNAYLQEWSHADGLDLHGAQGCTYDIIKEEAEYFEAGEPSEFIILSKFDRDMLTQRDFL